MAKRSELLTRNWRDLTDKQKAKFGDKKTFKEKKRSKKTRTTTAGYRPSPLRPGVPYNPSASPLKGFDPRSGFKSTLKIQQPKPSEVTPDSPGPGPDKTPELPDFGAMFDAFKEDLMGMFSNSTYSREGALGVRSARRKPLGQAGASGQFGREGLRIRSINI